MAVPSATIERRSQTTLMLGRFRAPLRTPSGTPNLRFFSFILILHLFRAEKIGNLLVLQPGNHVGLALLGGLTWSDECAVDELHRCAQDDLTCQDRQDVKAGHQETDGKPHRGGEAAEQRPTGDEHPVVVGLLPVMAEEKVLRRRGQCGGDRQQYDP